MARRSWLVAWSLGLSSLLVAGCYSPTLPLPPPSQPEITAPNDAGMIEIRGAVRPRSEVFAKNQRSLEIVGEETGSSGLYELTMMAESNDRIIVWYKDGSEESEFVELLVLPRVEAQGGAGGQGAE